MYFLGEFNGQKILKTKFYYGEFLVIILFVEFYEICLFDYSRQGKIVF